MTMTRQEVARLGGLATSQKYGSEHYSKIGHAGYVAALWDYPDFHSLGGQATAKLDLHTSATGATGIEAAQADGHKTTKQHRYLGGCDCCGRVERPGRYQPDGDHLTEADF